MDLGELKQNYKRKQKPYVLAIIFCSVLLVVSFTVLPISIGFLPDDSDFEPFIDILFNAPFVFSFALFGSLIGYTIKKEKHRVEIIEYIYSKLVSNFSNEGRHLYTVKSVLDMPKKYFRGLGLYRYHIVRCSLLMINSKTRHELYHVNFEQRSKNHNHVTSSGILYSYPISFHSRPEQIIDSLRSNGFKAPLKFVEFKGQYFLYYEIKHQIPIFKHFSEAEKQKFLEHTKIVFGYYDAISDVFD